MRVTQVTLMTQNEYMRTFTSKTCDIQHRICQTETSNFAVKHQSNEPSIALFDTGTTCCCILHHLFQKISHKVDMTRKSLWVNTASRTTLGQIGIVPLILDIKDHTFVHNFTICKKLKQKIESAMKTVNPC